MSDLNPLSLGDTPEDYIENDDGSVEILDMEEIPTDNSDFYSNLAETIAKSTLTDIALEYTELVEKDKRSRDKRDKQYEEGLRRTGLGDDAPGGAQFEGASRVVSPVLAEGCVDFAARAIKELFPAQGPVRTYVFGDADVDAIERAERKRQYMNWQLSVQMPEYRSELEQLLTQLPLGGSQYQKFWYDERCGRPVSEFIPIDEVYLPFSASSFYTAQRVTHRQLITKYEFNRRTKSGLYKEIDLSVDEELPDRSMAAVANDKIEGRSEDAYNDDGLRAVLEIYTWLDLDDDAITGGEGAPYILTIDEYTEEVLAVYRNWEEGDETFEKLDWIVEWKFIPWRGAYAIGLPHLIGGLSAAATGALRALMDSAHINNAPSMLKLKTGRTIGGNTSVNITEVTEVEAPPGCSDIRQIAMPMPFNQPSPVLFQLLGFLTDSAKGVIATADEKLNSVGDRTPVGTTMALIEQGSVTYSAIHARLHESQKKALQILSRINRQWLSDHEEIEDLGRLIISKDDFLRSGDIIPVSDPAIFSESQRFAQSQSLMQMAAQDAQNPNIHWNQIEVRRRMLKQMRIEGIDELLPAPKKPLTSDPLSESDAAMQGVPLKAADQQDHMAHINAHLTFISTPWVMQNPLVPPPAISAVLGHINEHILMYQKQVVAQMTQQVMQQAMMMGQPLNPEQATAMAIGQSTQVLGQQLQPIMQQIAQVQQTVQQRTPPAPMPPEVQASIQIAKMDIDRKAQYDQATLQNKQAELQAKQQLDVATFQAEQAAEQFRQQQETTRQQFEQFMAAQQQQADARADEMKGQIQLLINEQDNKQKQMTELLKNHEDNQTNLFIAQMKEQLASFQQQPAVEPSGPDTSAQLQQVQTMLEQLSKQQTNDSLSAIMQGLQATVEHLGKPKMIVRDGSGKAIGVRAAE
jgi:hypothetical protein